MDTNAFTDDILIEVLKWLPVDKLFALKCVCKKWDNIISSNYFVTVYQSEGRAQDNSPLGFYKLNGEYAFFPTCLQGWTNREENPFIKMSGFSFVDSRNGLLLFWNAANNIFRVCNPVTKKCRDIRGPFSNIRSLAIAFDVPFQKHSFEIPDKFVLIFFVASSLGEWYMRYTLSPGSTVWTRYLFSVPTQGINFKTYEVVVVINSVCYWLSLSNSVLSYELSPLQDSDEGFAKVIPLPLRNENDKTNDYVLCESIDGLLQYAISDSFKILVWVLNDSTTSQWVFRHAVCYEQMRYQFPKCHSSFCSWEDIATIRYAKLVAWHPSDPGIVFILLNELIITYCFRDRKVEVILSIRDRDKIPGDAPPWEWRCKIVPYFPPKWAASFLQPQLIIKPPQLINNTQCSIDSPIQTPKSHLGSKSWLAALLG